MLSDSLYPHTRACVRQVRHALLLLPCLFITGLFVNASAQIDHARPTARLIASSDHALQPTITRTTASVRPRSVLVGEETRREVSAHPSYGVSATQEERRAFDLINEARRAQGYAPLVWDAELTRMARAHSEQMARQNVLSHDTADGSMIARAHSLGIGGWRTLAENIAYNQGFDDPAAFAVERWLKSPLPRDNILRASFTHAGLGVARTPDGRVYFTQVFVAR
jgi:uncharacterized protein YkwD